MRRRIQAVARGQGRCDCGPIGVRLSRNGRPGAAVGFDGGGGDTCVVWQGPFFQTQSVSEDGMTRVVSVFMSYPIGATDEFANSAHTFEWSIFEEDPNNTSSILDPYSSGTVITATYLYINYTVIQCIVDGVIYRGNFEI